MTAVFTLSALDGTVSSVTIRSKSMNVVHVFAITANRRF